MYPFVLRFSFYFQTMHRLLLPFSCLYALATDVRNLLFDSGCLRSTKPPMPTIGIGNLAVGGTGKTPHAEFFARHLLAQGCKVAILSRGYGRSTRGYRAASPQSTAEEVGDEPLQMFRRFRGEVAVAVCERRAEGLKRLKESIDPDVVILDDVFQHRYVRPQLLILLTDCSRLYCDDCVVPAGRLRERRRGARRADVIIVTKCPPNLTEARRCDIIRRLKPLPHQQVFFSAMAYAPLTLPEGNARALLLTGIARPEPLVKHLQDSGIHIARHLKFPDHHRFSPSDLTRIIEAARAASCVITTAKDFARLPQADLPDDVVQKICVQEIEVRILFDQQAELTSTLKKLS